MPGLNGMDLQEELARRGFSYSIVFITGHGDIKTSVRAMKNGAVDFLSKPYDQQELLDAVKRALAQDSQVHEHQRVLSKVKRSLGNLTERENEVLRWVISGRLNKQIAFSLGVSEKTIKVHRGKVMEKMKASSVADLVRLAEIANISPVPKN
ncbi:MAG: Response regulator protein TmoT [Elusimicrobia bacterium]|nr:Response regulator protein TmoT [Elusimicrobiota bacterium]